MSASTRWLFGIGLAVLLAIVVSAVAAVLAGGPDEFAADTPERVVQDYLAAVADGDVDRAMAFMQDEVRVACGSLPRDVIGGPGRTTFRAELERTTETDDGVEVRLRVTEIYGAGPFGRNESRSLSSMYLVEEDEGVWRFSESPWPLYCQPARPSPEPSHATTAEMSLAWR